MFVNLKTNKPAYLIEHGTEVTYSLGAPDDKAHPHQNVSSYEFFAGHREATADEIADVPWLARLREPRPAAAKKPKAPPRAKAAAGAPKAARKGRKGAPTPKPPAGASAASPPVQSSGGEAAGGAAAAKPAGGEPHGE